MNWNFHNCPENSVKKVRHESFLLCIKTASGVLCRLEIFSLNSAVVLLPDLMLEWSRGWKVAQQENCVGAVASLGWLKLLWHRQAFLSHFLSGWSVLLAPEHAFNVPLGAPLMESGRDPALPSLEAGGWPPAFPAAHPEYLRPPQKPHPLGMACLSWATSSSSSPPGRWSHTISPEPLLSSPRLHATPFRYWAVTQPSVFLWGCPMCTVSSRKP